MTESSVMFSQLSKIMKLSASNSKAGCDESLMSKPRDLNYWSRKSLKLKLPSASVIKSPTNKSSVNSQFVDYLSAPSKPLRHNLQLEWNCQRKQIDLKIQIYRPSLCPWLVGIKTDSRQLNSLMEDTNQMVSNLGQLNHFLNQMIT